MLQKEKEKEKTSGISVMLKLPNQTNKRGCFLMNSMTQDIKFRLPKNTASLKPLSGIVQTASLFIALSGVMILPLSYKMHSGG